MTVMTLRIKPRKQEKLNLSPAAHAAYRKFVENFHALTRNLPNDLRTGIDGISDFDTEDARAMLFCSTVVRNITKTGGVEVRIAMLAGEALAVLRLVLIDEGRWLKTLEDIGLNRRQADRYMDVFKQYGQGCAPARTPLGNASFTVLAELAAPTFPPAVRKEIEQDIIDGKPVTKRDVLRAKKAASAVITAAKAATTTKEPAVNADVKKLLNQILKVEHQTIDATKQIAVDDEMRVYTSSLRAIADRLNDLADRIENTKKD